MSLGDVFNIRDESQIERLVGTINDPLATPGDVLTVQADGSVAAQPGGGGSQPGAVRVLRHEFDFTQAAALANGVPVWTPAVGDVLLNAWFEVDTDWPGDGTKAAKADIGVVTAGAWADYQGFSRGIFAYQVGPLDLEAIPTWVTDTDYASFGSASAITDLNQQSLVSAAGSGYTPVQVRWLTTNPLSLVVSDDGNPSSAAYDGSAGAGTLYLVVSSPAVTP